jgi:hypothetical protein
MQPEHISRLLEVLQAYERQAAQVDALAKQVINTDKLNQIVQTSIALDSLRDKLATAATSSAISSSLAISAEAARRMSGALTGLGSYDELLERLVHSDRWIASLDAIGKMALSDQLNRHLGVILQSSLLTEQAIARIAARSLSISQGLGQAFLKMGTAQRDIWRSLEANIQRLASIPRVAVEAAGVDYYLAAHQIDVLPADASVQPQDESLLGQLSARVTDIPHLVTSMGADLLPLYRGALEAIRSKNPDRIRQASISLRELFTQILHRLAPDSEVLRWIPERSLLDEKGCPTRRARLRYICRHVDHGDFSPFIEADLDAALRFLNLVQKGTHAVTPEFTGAQLEALLIRMESLLFHLIKLGTDTS